MSSHSFIHCLHPPADDNSRRTQLIAILLVALLTLLNIIYWLTSPPPKSTSTPLSSLRRPDPWIGFSDVNYTGSYFTWSEELTFPEFLAPVDSGRPDYTYPLPDSDEVGHQDFLPLIGNMTRDDRRMVISETVSSDR